MRYLLLFSTLRDSGDLVSWNIQLAPALCKFAFNEDDAQAASG